MLGLDRTIYISFNQLSKMSLNLHVFCEIKVIRTVFIASLYILRIERVNETS